MRKKSLLLLISIIIPFLIRAEWIPIDKNKSSQSLPHITLLSDDNNSTVLKIEISGFNLEELVSKDKTYQTVDLLSESFTSKLGFPSLPYLAKVLAIPDHASVSVEILETGEIQTFENIHLPPARESWYEGDPETPYFENMDVYEMDGLFPHDYVNVDDPSVFRDFRIARVAAYPLRYNPVKKELQVVTSMTIRVNYGSGDVINPKTAPKRHIAPSFGQLYKDFIFNYQSVLEDSYGGKEEGHELMLCIMPDEYYDSFLPYAEWKRQSGIDIHITKFSDIGANSTNTAIIKTHVEDAYLNWTVPPTYVLIVGDNGVFPVEMISLQGWSFPYESFFVELEGSDVFPEMFLGRLTNESDYGMQVMLNKFKNYEKTPYTASTDWFKKGICCSNDYYPSQVETKRFAAEKMLIDGGFISVDTMMDSDPCNYYLSDAINALNNGRSFLNYRGEGWYSGWDNHCVEMETSDVSSLANGQKLTFVTSIGCGVANFALSGGNCFGEEWVELGTLISPKGGVGFIGPGSNTHTTYNNKLDKGIYVGMFQEGLNTAGQGLARGRLYLYNVFGTDPYVEYHSKIYMILGDPSIHPWKDVPLDVTVYHPASVVTGTNMVEFTVNHTTNGLPVENAVVCVTGNDVFATGTTDASGLAILEITSEALQTLTVTVTGGNVYPYQGTMEVIPPVGPYCVKEYYLLDDNAGGNGNTVADYGESILLSLALENIGTTEATNVNVELSTSDPYITFTDDQHTYASIQSGQSILATNAFSFNVADDIPDGHEVFVNVTAGTLFQSWNSYISIIGHAPLLSLGSLLISDPGGNNNGLLDPGENITITIPVSNNGSSISPDATVYLSSTSSHVTLNTTSDNLGAIDIGENVEASYSVSVSPSAPLGASVDFNFDVDAGSYDTSKIVLTSIGIMVEDYETGDFNRFPWVMGGNADWTLVTADPYEGVYCARSGNITHDQVSEMEVTLSVTGEGEVSFYRKVSCEDGPSNEWDYLAFFIDGSEQDRWDGEVAWGQVSYPVTAGVHTFKWVYSKDYVEDTGEDCAWVDHIEFPYPVPPVSIPYQTEFEEAGNIPDGWHNDTGDDFNWTINSGSTPSNNTGPSGDHTTGSGYYMYTEATDPNNPNKRADLITPTFDLSSLADVEVRFWYHMYDNTPDNYMGTLHLDVFHNEVWFEDVMTPISGNQGDQWHEQVVDLSAYAGEVIELRFRGITGAGYASDISIDDFSIDGTLQPTNLIVDLTAFLEGPCTGTEMSTFLCACSSIPLSQPFDIAPWNYNGTESVIIMPGNTVDWILVELRDATSATNATPSTTIARQAALLLKDGRIVAMDGSSPLSFNNTVSNNLFTVIHHRNHLAIMSANEIILTGDNYTYDFTTASELAHGINSQKELSAGIWGMLSGDADANGTIGNEDLNPAWSENAGKAGYIPTDLNLDQQVDNIDKDNYWVPNKGKGTNVPE